MNAVRSVSGRLGVLALVTTLGASIAVGLPAGPAVAGGAAGPAAAGAVPPPAPGTLVSADPADLTPHARDGEARAFAEIGNTVYVGGTFTAVKANGAAAWTERAYLIGYDRTTGALSSSFLPSLNGAVNALAVSPDGKLIVGGTFNTVNGVARRQLVALDPATGQTVAGWVGRSDGGMVRTMAVHGDWLYVGGAFHWINGTEHSLIARLNARTGAVDPTFGVDASVAFHTSEYVWTLAVSPDGRSLVIGGNFTMVDGQPRSQLALIDLTGTPTVADWSTQRFTHPCFSHMFTSYVMDVDFSDDGGYFVVGTTGGRGAGSYCDTITRWETGQRGAGLDATWVDDTGLDTVTSVEATDGVVYAAGHFRWLNNANGSDSQGPGGIDRLGIGVLNPTNGMPLAWNPRRSGGANLPPGATAWGQLVPVLWRGSDGLYFGHNSDGMGHEYHGRMGMFPLAGGRTVLPKPAEVLPGHLYLGTASGRLTKVAFNGSALGAASTLDVPQLSPTAAAFVAGDKVYWARTAPGDHQLQASMFNGRTVGAPWTIGWNAWFDAAVMTGAFHLDGRMYYTKAGSDALFYRYLELDGYFVGCTEFTLPTANLAWSTVRGMAAVSGRIVFGATDGALRSVPFDPTAAGGVAVNGAAATLLAAGTPERSWSSPTLFYAAR